MSVNPETLAIQGLRFFYAASRLAPLPFENLLSYYRQQGSFMHHFGGAVGSAPQEKTRAAMEKLGKNSSGFPRTSDFFDYLAKEVGSLSFRNVVSAGGTGIAEGVTSVGKIALEAGKSSLMLYVAIAAIGVFVIPNLPKLLKSVK